MEAPLEQRKKAKERAIGKEEKEEVSFGSFRFFRLVFTLHLFFFLLLLPPLPSSERRRQVPPPEPVTIPSKPVAVR